MESAHETLEGILRDILKVEDGHRLSSLDSLKAGQATAENVIDEFASLVQQMDLSSKDDKLYEAIESMWKDATERFNFNSQSMQQSFKKSKQDSMVWTQQRLNVTPKQRHENMKLIQMIDNQLTNLFQAHAQILDLNTQVNEHRNQKETLSFQLTKLQKDNKEIDKWSTMNNKLKNTIETQEHEKLTMQQKI